ncbi:MAG TPA: hypothetical protein ENJ95_23835 [Bacteroidetes bacterium]|nr:hypothetical protein [Bacteroidota bacterium]
MALIGKIRQKKWLLIGSLAGALALFILMLMFDNPNQSFFGGSRTMVGEIEGRKIEYKEFNQVHDMLYRNAQTDGFSGRTFLWNYFVDEALVKKEADAIGLGVSKKELLDLQFSPDQNRLSQLIKSRYSDPNTRAVDMEQLRQLKDIVTGGQIDQMIKDRKLVGDFKYRWAHQEKEVIKDRLQTKIANMVSKGMYTPTWMAEMLGEQQGKQVDFLFVQIPYDAINNAEVTLEDSDYKAYFEENKKQYIQDEETRKLDYVVFKVLPSAEDSTNIKKEIAELVPKFRATDNDSLFVETNLGTIDAAYVKKDALSSAIADTVFKMPIGSVYGPYLDVNTYKAVKLLDRKIIPDSVSAKHILRKASDYNSLVAAQKTIDSLKALIETGAASFDSLAVAFSEDPSNAGKGGDLGTFGPGTMVKQFNDVCFYKAEPGKVYSVVTQFGVHLIQVYDQKFETNSQGVQLAYLTRDIIPSQNTQDAVKELALDLQEESTDIKVMRTTAAAKGYDLETSNWLKANDYAVGTLGAGQGSREMVRWAFGDSQNTKEPSVGDVSPQVYSFQDQGKYYVSKFAVAALKAIRPAGEASFEDVKSEMEAAVIDRKKAAMITEALAGITDLQTIANKYSSKVDTARNVSFASAYIQAVGSAEPDVVATAFKTDLNQVSAPIAGANGVYVVKPINKPAVAASNAAQARQTNQQMARIQVPGKIVPSLRKHADIEDNRSRFF